MYIWHQQNGNQGTDSYYNVVFTPNGKLVFNFRIHALFLNNLKCLDLSSFRDRVTFSQEYISSF